ncbi:B3/4 domain-containing protein [Marinactinospora rubrisoli]|uniref:B3/4 domain-containing protein n=1 Tax=Marinactinospora rubrisoli TaxID=2715399 RepID=A0ABW2KMH0_9ACTN
MTQDLAAWLGHARVDDSVFDLRPDYRALVLVAEDLRPGPSDDISEKLLAHAEEEARGRLAGAAPEELAHVAAWRAAFRAFGAKPQRTRTSVEALLRRVADGLPRVNRLTDAYNAVSIAHTAPLGGEDADRYSGPLRLVRATGEETFETVNAGETAVEHPAPGEVVWRDDAGVTCRRWNWRQCVRTRLTESTTRGVFVIDALDPLTDDDVLAVGTALADALRATSPEARIHSRLLARGTA